MKIQVDITEKISQGKKIVSKSNLNRTYDLINQKVNKLKQDINLLQNENVMLQKDNVIDDEKINDNLKSIKDYELEIHTSQLDQALVLNLTTRDKYHDTTSYFPQYCDQEDVTQANLNKDYAQGDFLVKTDDGRTSLIELKSTFATLKDAILDYDYAKQNGKMSKLEQTFTFCRLHNISFKVLVVLPEENEDIQDYISKNDVTQKQFKSFMKSNTLPIRKLKMPHFIYVQGAMNYFIEYKKNRDRLKEKQERIIRKIIKLNEK